MQPDPELYMTEYAAIRIVLHSTKVVHLDPLAMRLARSDPTDSKAPVYCHKTNGYGHHPAFPTLGTISHERPSRDCEGSPYCIRAHEDQYPFTPILALPLH